MEEGDTASIGLEMRLSLLGPPRLGADGHTHAWLPREQFLQVIGVSSHFFFLFLPINRQYVRG